MPSFLGVGSVLHDNPRLTLRKADYEGVKQPIRVILDSRSRTPRNANVLTDGAPTLVVSDSGLECFGSLSSIEIEKAEEVELDGPRDLENLLKLLALLGCNDVLVEAGAKVVSSFLKEDYWDEWISYVAPMLLGKDSRRLTDLDIVSIQDGVSAQVTGRKMFGSDLRLILRLHDFRGATKIGHMAQEKGEESFSASSLPVSNFWPSASSDRERFSRT